MTLLIQVGMWFTDLWSYSLAEADYIHRGRWGWPMRGCIWFAAQAYGTDPADIAQTFLFVVPSSWTHLVTHWHTTGTHWDYVVCWLADQTVWV